MSVEESDLPQGLTSKPDVERACTDLCRSDEQRSFHRNGYQGVGAVIFRARVIGFVPGGTGNLVVPSPRNSGALGTDTQGFRPGLSFLRPPGSFCRRAERGRDCSAHGSADVARDGIPSRGAGLRRWRFRLGCATTKIASPKGETD
jgi:hypothetical protein